MIKKNNFDVYLNLLKEIQQYEENNKSSSKISDVFSQYLNDEKTINESFYFLNCMIDYNLLEVKTIQDMKNPYFIHLNPKITKNLYGCWFKHEIKMQNIEYEDLKKNDWELHKQYIKEGHNPNEIAKIIRNDEIEKLQEISSQSNFDYNQTIKPSLYERYSFIDKENVTLIDYAAFFSAEKCFKYLLMNGSNAINTGKYAIAGGNLEIIHLCEQNHSSFEDAYETAIQYHRNDIFKYIYENKILEINRLDEFGVKCISCHNYEIFLFLLKEGMKVNNNIINEAATHGNLFLVKYFLKENQLPKSILSFSAKSGNIELVKYILEQKEIDIKHKDINLLYFMFFQLIFLFLKIS